MQRGGTCNDLFHDLLDVIWSADHTCHSYELFAELRSFELSKT
jgi:hypothetical protein